MKIGQWLASVSVLFASSGCSLFFDLNANQCKVTADCTDLGPQFKNSLCVSNVCVAKNAGSGGSSGDGPSGGTGSSGKPGVAGKGGGSGSDEAGAAGEGPAPECATNGDCIDAHLDQPYLCVDGKCLALTSDDCPQMVPSTGTLDLLRKPRRSSSGRTPT